MRKDFRGKGIGKTLKNEKIREARRLNYHSMICEVLSTNSISISLNLNIGFRIVGEIIEAGFREGKWIGLVIMQKSLS